MTPRGGRGADDRAGAPGPAATPRSGAAGLADPARQTPAARTKRLVAALVLGAVSLAVTIPMAQASDAQAAALPAAANKPATLPADSAAAAIKHELRTFATTGRVLHIGAHPDDENTQLIAYLSRGRGYDTAYLSITRGDGGQNLLGPQLGEELGVARTQELLAARRIDGGRQFFTRAIDFGFSKSPEETLSIWNHREVLGDVVRIIRRFRPDVVVTRFPIPPGSGGHGHHTASAILAVEAFKLAGDPKAYPEQLREGLAPWQPRRIVWNSSGFSRGGGIEKNPSVKVDIGGVDPVTGEGFAGIAARSRAMHKTQAMGGVRSRDDGASRLETFVLLGGEPATNDLMDGVDTTWARVPEGAEIGKLAADVLAHFDAANPANSVSALLAIRHKLSAVPAGAIADDKRAQLDRILQGCLGLEVTTRAESATIIPGETMHAVASAKVRAAAPRITWVAVDFPGGQVKIGRPLEADRAASQDITFAVAKDQPVTQPYWLRRRGTEGMSRVDDPALIGRPENPVELPVRYTFRVGDQTLVVTDRPTGGAADRHGDRLPLAVIPPVITQFKPDPAVFRPGATTIIELEVRGGRPDVTGTVRLEAPAGWTVSAPQVFHTTDTFHGVRLTFEVTAPKVEGAGVLRAWAKVDGREWSHDAITLHYPHIPFELLQPPSEKKVVSVLVGTRGHTIGYIMGAGDDVPAALTQLGYQVTQLKSADLTLDKLKTFDAVVIGVRAFNARPDLAANTADLFAYVEQGGTVVCQYNWSRNLLTKEVAPYPLNVSDLRITDENARVTFLVPDHPILNTPNRITEADFAGWVQERGTYYPSQWDSHFVPLLEMNDPGETPLRGALLAAPHGKGWFVYTGLAFFRQLPAGVPGAYRLFANLVSLGK